MFQEFFKDTLVSRFIKRLLRTSNLCKLHRIYDQSYIIAGCKYIYNNFIIEALSSGKFYVDPEAILYPSDDIYPASYLYVHAHIKEGKDAGKIIELNKAQYGDYKIISYYDPNDPLIHYQYHSKYSYYDSGTHIFLGEYLRDLKHMNNLNLMPYYNCVDTTQVLNLSLGPDSSKSEDADPMFTYKSNSKYKIVAAHVKFGETYTVALDSPYPIRYRTFLYSEHLGLIKNPKTNKYYDEELIQRQPDYGQIMSAKFTEPFIINISTPKTSEIFSQEKNLILALEIPKELDTSVVVLEGNYMNSWRINKINFENPKNQEIMQDSRFSNLTLLHFNCHKILPFSDRLLEYLLLNVIHSQEELSGNIEYFQELLRNKGINESLGNTGIWNNLLNQCTMSILNNIKENEEILLRDQDSNLNIDLERYLINCR